MLLLQLQILQKHVHGNSATATSASKCTGNSATATKLQTARNIKLQGAVSRNANFDGSGNVTMTTTQSNISVLTGQLTYGCNAGGTYLSGSKTISYPSGYNKSNCIVLSIGTYQQNASYGYSFGTLASSDYSVAWLMTSIGKSVTLNDSSIKLDLFYGGSDSTWSEAQSITVNYKIVLMKIS